MSERGRRFFAPDESGMGGSERAIGEAYYDPDGQRWFVPESENLSRPATPEEVRAAKDALDG